MADASNFYVQHDATRRSGISIIAVFVTRHRRCARREMIEIFQQLVIAGLNNAAFIKLFPRYETLMLPIVSTEES